MFKKIKTLIFDVRWTFCEPPHNLIEGFFAVSRYFLWHFLIKKIRKIFVGNYQGLRFIYDTKVDWCGRSYITPYYEFGLQRIVCSLIGKNDTYVDVGANVGTEVLLALRSGGIVHAFEPAERIYRLLLINILLNNYQQRVICNQLAVSDKAGTVQFFENDPGYSGLSSLIADNHFLQIRSKVKAISLDQYFKEHKIKDVTLLKIDVEGAEELVMNGLVNSLRKGVVKVVHWESNYEASKEQRLKILSFVESFGYRNFGLDIKNKKFVKWNNHRDCISVKRNFVKNFLAISWNF